MQININSNSSGSRSIYLPLLLLILLPFNLKSQQTSTFNYLRNYTAKEYNAVPQNWAIVQDKRGVMYFGNNKGVLEYDGVTWNLISIPNEIIRSLTIDDNNLIYIGGVGQIGYLAPDSVGEMQYFSLLEFINEQDRHFSEVWNTYATAQGVYFQTSKKIFRWNEENMKIWNVNEAGDFNAMFYIPPLYKNKQHFGGIFIRQKERGLMKIKGDSLFLLPNGALFANHGIYCMLPFNPHGRISSIPQGKEQILIISTDIGLFLMDAANSRIIYPFHTSLDDFFLNYIAYKGTVLPDPVNSADNNYSIGTIGGGSIIINSKGEIIQLLNRNSDLQNETIWFQYLDRQKNLWLALDNGVSKVEISSPLTFVNTNAGLEGRVESI
ncbi:MAG: hypothetical protein IIA88_10125, partial [Bacteroidetes bacterium]|nr:hypothetical protein [Bacteroidota bacterium]